MIEESDVRLAGDTASAATEAVLPDRRELAFVAMEFTRMAMAVTDPRLPDNPIVLANKAFLELTGYTSEEVLGQNCRFLQGPDTDPRTVQKIRQALVEQKGITLDVLNYRKDGSPFWNELRICPVHDQDGQLLYHFASQFDVGDRHRVEDLEAVERVLLREIEHRAKNALALVQGIVRMSQADSAEEFARLVQGRVDTLAHAHSMLAEQRWKNVPLHHLLEAEIADLDCQRVTLDGPSWVEIGPTQVQPLILVLHEVIDNAVRHGALSTLAGTMQISWRFEDGHTVIDLAEAGGPVPADDRQPGFGTRIINTIVERQLGGRIAQDWCSTGLKSQFVLPELVR